ncbi:MAG: TRAP transporter large permease [Aminobacteriaceae bacterium]|uniref:TRAP transporter large permease n=1 Tax=Aminivibrio sp. TaxID=1872489 RepID=UPI00345F1395
MEPVTVGVIGIVALLASLGMGVSIGLAFILVSFATVLLLMGFDPAISFLGQTMYHSIASPNWCSIPLFILMGAFAAVAGFGKAIYDGLYKLTRRWPGSLAVATCFGSAIFGAISGSSLANTAIFGKLVLPEMDRYKYDRSFAAACVASAGTFANMIPPSINFVIFALFTEQSIARLFAAGVIPGIFTALVYAASIFIRVKRNPHLAPEAEVHGKLSFKEKIECYKKMMPIGLVILVTFGGIYGGVFSPTEAAAAGCLITLIVGWFQGAIKKFGDLREPLRESANTTAMLFIINVGALFFSRFFALTDIPTELAMLVQGWDVPRWVILFGILVVYFLLGMIMVEIGIYALTLPIFMPIILSLGYDPIWFGVVVLKLSEIAAITPPVGLNVYMAKAVAGKNVSLEEIFRGIWPFCLCDIIVLIVLILFPQLSLWLPNLLMGN